ncbi:MAG: 4-hydroxy-3-methylbut-2-enyl diphosphate reductase [Planctomycetes bacterium]|nr:4-hydroxy-3-methylbut-2-enyl diphosphate reductase [Planctomycetota bacterium]
MPTSGFRVVLASPRGFCAGVDRAIEIVERALERYGRPVYVRHEIVHNAVVVDDLRKKGAVFVDELADVPADSWVVFSAHGVPPQVVQEAETRGLRVVDATCPLVTKVHVGARAWNKKEFTIFLVGHRDHVEVEGVVGEAPDRTIVIENVEEAERVEPTDPTKVAVLTQTTLSVDEARDIIHVLERRFPNLRLPLQDDICYATQNRQDAVKALSDGVDLWLVIGDPTSSNSNRLRERGESRGVESHLILDQGQIDPEWLVGKRSIGVTSGASTPEISVRGVIARLRELGATEVVESDGPVEDIVFTLPEAVR